MTAERAGRNVKKLNRDDTFDTVTHIFFVGHKETKCSEARVLRV